MLVYDEEGLIRQLDDLDVTLRAAFAAACAERLGEAYETFAQRTGRGDPAAVREIMDHVWSALMGLGMEADIRAELARCMAVLPKETHTPWVEEQAYAEDAVSAAAYALRTLINEESREAAWAARCAYNALDYYVMNHLGIDNEDQISGHPLVQAELARQRRDLEELRKATDGAERNDVIDALRLRAGQEASSFFGRS